MKLLCLTKYTRRGPSSRYRVHQFLPYLTDRGFDIDIQSLHDASYFAGTGGRDAFYTLRRAAKRIAKLLTVRRYDLVFVQKEIFPYVPDVVELVLHAARVPIVLDIDDAVYVFYSNRPGLRNKFARVIGRAALVLAGNEHLKNYAERFSDNVVLFPTVVDTGRFARVESGVRRRVPVVGWIGSPTTVRYLHPLERVLERLAHKNAFELAIVGAAPIRPAGVDVTSKPWSEADEVSDLAGFDIGIMPLDKTPWSDGKCSLKLLQYMSMGIASVASPRGSAPVIIAHGDNGLLADTDDEWFAALGGLVADAGLRESIGTRGRRWIEENYSLERYGPLLADHLETAALRVSRNRM